MRDLIGILGAVLIIVIFGVGLCCRFNAEPQPWEEKSQYGVAVQRLAELCRPLPCPCLQLPAHRPITQPGYVSCSAEHAPYSVLRTPQPFPARSRMLPCPSLQSTA
jgi:hypothetical protein